MNGTQKFPPRAEQSEFKELQVENLAKFHRHHKGLLSSHKGVLVHTTRAPAGIRSRSLLTNLHNEGVFRVCGGSDKCPDSTTIIQRTPYSLHVFHLSSTTPTDTTNSITLLASVRSSCDCELLVFGSHLPCMKRKYSSAMFFDFQDSP